MRIDGIGVSKGIAIGRVFILKEVSFKIPTRKCKDPKEELEKLSDAMTNAIEEIVIIKSISQKTLEEKQTEVFDAHIEMVRDPVIFSKVKDMVQLENINVIKAYHKIIQSYIKKFSSMEDEYMRNRMIDLKDVSNRVLSHLLGIPLNDPREITYEVIVCADEFTPSDTARLNKDFVIGFASSNGGTTSHSAIMARSLKTPSVVGLSNILLHAKNDETIIVNGIEGYVILSPTKEEIKRHEEIKRVLKRKLKDQEKFTNLPCFTKDHIRVDLLANIGIPDDIKEVNNVGADGIGLFRTEFLYMKQRRLPTEGEQYRIYREVLEAFPNKKVIIRTLDIGGDKKLSYLPVDKDMDSSFGYRGLRFSLNNLQIFKAQLRALLRASMHGDLHIMFPMVSTLVELRRAKTMVLEFKQELQSEGFAINKNFKIGIMVEVPSVAMMADQFAKEVDFFSIGTNDLIQYLFAAERGNSKVSYLYQPLNPSLLRLIKQVIDASHKEGIWTSMCGEMAGDALAAPILLGLGLDSLSMKASSILEIRQLFTKFSKERMINIANETLNLTTEREVIAFIHKHLGQ